MYWPILFTHASTNYTDTVDIQNSVLLWGPRPPLATPMAIAKMTAQCALYVGALKIFGTPWLRPRLLFTNFLWAFAPIEPMNVPPKFEVRSLPVSRGTKKIWAAPGYAHAPFSPKFLMGFYSDWPCKCTRQIWSPYSFTHSRDNRGYPKKFGQLLDTPTLHFLQNF